MNNMTRRRRGLMGAKENGLPSSYQQVEWIGTNKDAVILTNKNAKLSTKIRGGFQRTDDSDNTTSGYPSFFGSTDATNVQIYLQCVGGSYSTSTNAYLKFGNSGEKSLYGVNLRNVIHDIILDKNSLIWDGTKKSNVNATSLVEISDRYIGVLGRTSASGITSTYIGRCAYFQIFEDDVLVCDLVPCYRKSDGEIGMYDLVQKMFFTNVGTGTFTKGADVT